MTFAKWARVILWENQIVEDGKCWIVVAVGPRMGDAFFAIRRELTELSTENVQAQTAAARQELAKTLRNLADKISAGTIES